MSLRDALIITSVLQNQPSPQGKLPKGISHTHTRICRGGGGEKEPNRTPVQVGACQLPCSKPLSRAVLLSGLVGRKEFGVGMEREYSRVQEAKRGVLKMMNPKSLASVPLIFPPGSKC